MATMIGQILTVQEGRFWLNNKEGIAHHFALAYDAYVPDPGLHNLQKQARRVLITYTETRNECTGLVHRVRVL